MDFQGKFAVKDINRITSRSKNIIAQKCTLPTSMYHYLISKGKEIPLLFLRLSETS